MQPEVGVQAGNKLAHMINHGFHVGRERKWQLKRANTPEERGEPMLRGHGPGSKDMERYREGRQNGALGI